ncbi:hypothetical protein EJ110_NYTH37566 [Nymphaea thermarum]|nr:uncharacterized protein LOC116259731 [Nymphaea colorata]KAF3781151.1 hypothetical protein EJ110_NYTH37566 [Nymphaea thermarum]
MGNCQAAEAATVIIQHPSGRIQRVYWSVSAAEIMNDNPGHYVASLAVCFSDSPTPGTGVTRVKLLRPQDTLHLGRIYRLINSQDIMKELWEKYGKTKLKHRNVVEKDMRRSSSRPQSHSQKRDQQQEQDGRRSRSSQSTPRPGQWRPSLQSISEVDFPCRIEPCRVNKHKQLTYSQSTTEFHAY